MWIMRFACIILNLVRKKIFKNFLDFKNRHSCISLVFPLSQLCSSSQDNYKSYCNLLIEKGILIFHPRAKKNPMRLFITLCNGANIYRIKDQFFLLFIVVRKKISSNKLRRKEWMSNIGAPTLCCWLF